LGHTVSTVHYVRVASLVSALATLGGALGTVLETNAAVRAAAYCIRPVSRANEP
ncbi:MAG: hypothetical protein JWP01_3449, partial [Myxococcales bacterium]|nr:hypothetical protein [Myxococcales bacterium]